MNCQKIAHHEECAFSFNPIEIDGVERLADDGKTIGANQ
jgi:hypothetical protein